MNGAAPRPRTWSTVAFTATAMFAMPRLPAVTATRSPARTRDPRSSDRSASLTRPATSSIFGPRTDWRARKNEGRSRAIAGSYRRSLAAVLEDTDRAHFDERGYLRVPGAFTPSEAEAMRDVVWRALERQGFRRDDPTTWVNESPSNLQSLKGDDVFKAIGSDRTLTAIDDVIGAGRWKQPSDWGAYFLLFPTPDACGLCRGTRGTSTTTMPPRSRRVDGLKVHSMFGDVAPRAGGMTIVAGSHHARGAPLRRPSAPTRSKGRPAAQAAHAQQRLSPRAGHRRRARPADRSVLRARRGGVRHPVARRRADCERGRRDPHPPVVAAHAPDERGHSAEVPAEQGPLPH